VYTTVACQHVLVMHAHAVSDHDNVTVMLLNEEKYIVNILTK